MGSTDEYTEIARVYADGVRVLFAPTGAAAGERGGRGPASPGELVDRGEKLSTWSAELTRITANQLADPDPAVRARASTRLLAKAITDLDVSGYLWRAAEDEEDDVPWVDSGGGERGPADRGAVEECLKLLVNEAGAGLGAIERGEKVPLDLATARGVLTTSVEDALDLIPKRAGKAGQAALEGLLVLSISQVADAAGAIGTGIAKVIAPAEKVSRLYVLFRGFVVQAFDAVVELVGSKLIKEVAERVIDWVKDLKEGEVFCELLEKLFETEWTNAYLCEVVKGSHAGPAAFAAAAESVDGLEESYRRQAALVAKLISGIKFVAVVPAAALPQGALLVAAAYIVLGGYVVLAASDYVDARRLKLLDRVPGVRTVVETQLLNL